MQSPAASPNPGRLLGTRRRGGDADAAHHRYRCLPISPSELLTILLGGGEPTARFFVLEQRAPRAVAAVVVGICLALAGAIFQTLSNNPLGSPDIIGFTTGAATGGLVMILVAGASVPGGVATGATLGGLATALLVWSLSVGRGLAGERLILVGIAVGAMLSSINDYLLTRADLESAEAARAWQFGSLNAVGWGQLSGPVVIVGLPLLVLWLWSPSLRALETGDDLAAALGVRVTRDRTMLLATGVLFTAIGVAIGGPIGFVALAAPQIARRLTASPGISLLGSAALGAALLGSADLLAARILSPFQIPVGLATSAVGGLYLVWLLSRRRR
ncbi:FecCD family ABC transporter permease [Naumannella halotolerans]|uniref:Iron complex transport system permease protein n=1 Tax=Naumannella halotolerans TaxID=993414 RepID=A0A4R7JBE1_9ACTN|nr:iron chelate uptake ABC transporter family permease subunit [Naumannella halotolerans]TDT34286.1 iron complex transport system permease protein [Naumannella halotolerans]